MTTIYHDVQVDEVFLQDVEFTGNIQWEDPSYDDEYGRIELNPFPYCDDINWAKDKYTFTDNTTIDAYLEYNYSKIEMELIEEYAKNTYYGL
jgi:hypothetical protein